MRKAILLIITSIALFSLFNCFMKLLMRTFGPYELLGYRSFFSIVLSFIGLAILRFKTGPQVKFTRTNLLRGVSDFVGIPLWMLALHHMQVTQVISIAFLTPIICALLATIALKDRMTVKRWLACFISMLGVTIITKPDIHGFNYYSFVVLTVCVLWAISGVLLKKLSLDKQHPLVIIIYNNVVIFLLAIPCFISSITLPSKDNLIMLICMGVTGFLGNLCMAQAYRLTRITNLLPFEYLKLIFSAIFAFIIFGEVISINTIVGATIILLAAFYIFKSSEKNT